MSWWNGNKRLRDEHTLVEHDSKIEIVAHKKATKAQITEVRKANDALNKIFEKNHFTLTIYVAAGGNSQKLTTKVAGETPKKWKRV